VPSQKRLGNWNARPEQRHTAQKSIHWRGGNLNRVMVGERPKGEGSLKAIVFATLGHA